MLIENLSSLPSCFITATDTDAGKTFISCQILNAWKTQGHSVGAFKPVASGAIWQQGQLVSEDALELAKVTGQPLQEINPFTFEEPTSPHIADKQNVFNIDSCLKQLQKLHQKYDRVLVEGVGGWCVPLNNELMLADLANAFQLPIIMIARMGLGCINHSLLTIKQIQHDSALYHGWIANVIDPSYDYLNVNIQAIKDRT